MSRPTRRFIHLALQLATMGAGATLGPAQTSAPSARDEPPIAQIVFDAERNPELRALFDRAEGLRQQGDHAPAASVLRETIPLLEALQQPSSAAWVCFDIGNCWQNAGDAVLALAALEDAAARFERLADLRGWAMAESRRGEILLNLQRAREAIRAFEAAALAFKELGNTTNQAFAICWLGDCYSALGEIENAEHSYAKGVEGLELVGHTGGIANNAALLGEVRFRLERYDAAILAFETSMQAAAQIEAPLLAAWQVKRIADCHVRAGRAEEGLLARREYLQRTIDAVGEDHFQVVLARQWVADDLEDLKKISEAEAEHRAAVAGARRLVQRGQAPAADVPAALGNFLRRQGRAADAREWFEEALVLETANASGDSPWVLARVLDLAACLFELGCLDEALVLYEDAVVRARQTFRGDSRELAEGLEWTATTLWELGRAHEGLPLLHECRALLDRLDPGDFWTKHRVLSRLGSSLRSLNRVDEALLYFLEASEMQQRIGSGDAPAMADALERVGDAYLDLNRAADALPQHEASLAMRRQLFPNGGALLAYSLSAVGNCHLKLRQPAEAVPLFEEALAIVSRLPTPDPWAHATALHDLALAWRNLGDLDCALPLLFEALEILSEHGWEARERTADVLFDLGNGLRGLGRAHDAVFYIERAVATYEAGFANDVNVVAAARLELGYCLRETGRYVDAQAEYETALAIQRRLADERSMLGGLAAVAHGLLDLAQLAEAQRMADEMLAVARRVYVTDALALARELAHAAQILMRADPRNPLENLNIDPMDAWVMLREKQPVGGPCADAALLLCEARLLRAGAGVSGDNEDLELMLNLVACYLRDGQRAPALAVARERLALCRAVPQDWMEISTSQIIVGVSLLMAGRVPEAMPAFQEALDLMTAHLPPDDSNLRGLRSLLAGLIWTNDRPEKALPMLEQALAAQRATHPGDHDQTAAVLLWLGGCLRDLGRTEEALERHREAFDMLRRLYPADHPRVLDGICGVARSLMDQGDYAGALVLFDSHPELTDAGLIGDSPMLAGVLCSRARCLDALGEVERAVRLFEQAVAMSRRMDLTLGDIGVCDLAGLYLRLGRAADATTLLEGAISRIESLREQARDVDELERSAYFEYLKRGGEYDLMVDAQLALDNPTAALRYLERGRARGLLDLLERGRFDPLAQLRYRADVGGDAALLGRIEATRAQLDAREEAVARLEYELASARERVASDAADADAKRRAIEQAETALQDARLAQREATRAWFTLVSEMLPMSRAREPAELQQMLGPSERLLIYHVNRYSVNVFIVRPPGETDGFGAEISCVPLGWRVGSRGLTGPELEAAVEDYLAALARDGLAARGPAMSERLAELSGLASPNAAQRSEREVLEAALADLDRSLSRAAPTAGPAAPAAELGWHLFMALVPEVEWNVELRRARRLYVVPHGPLNRLPLETLVLLPGETAAECRYWLDDGPPLVYAPSGSALLWSRQRREEQRGRSAQSPPPLEVVALGDPIFRRDSQSENGAAALPSAGVYVLDVPAGAGAAAAGLAPGDVITAYDGRPCADHRALRDAVDAVDDAIDSGARRRVPVDVRVWRAGVEQSLALPPGRIGADVAKVSPRELLVAQSAGAFDAAALTTERSGALTRDGGLLPLPGTRAEVLSIYRTLTGQPAPAERGSGGASTMADSQTVRVLLGDNATETEIFALAPAARYLHLATHQLVDETDDASYSRLALTLPAVVTPADNGFLTLSELLDHWRDRISRCELVVLSACETQVGRRQRDEAVYALPIGFQYAGAPSVIASLWRVNDASTAVLMGRFYEGLKSPMADKLLAFTQARQALRRTHPEPYFWAPFIYIGDPR